MNGVDAFTRGFTQAIARRAKQEHQAKQHTQKVNSRVTESNVDAASVTPAPPASSVKQSDDEYRTAIVTKMLNLIAKQKDKTND